MRRNEMMKRWPFVVVNKSPVLAPTVKPTNVMPPALALLVTMMSTAQSFAGAVMVKAALLATILIIAEQRIDQ